MPEHDPRCAAPAWLHDGTLPVEDEVLGLLKTGKEAEVFIVERRTLDGRQRALLVHKRYRPTKVKAKGELEALGFTKARTFINDHVYHEGRRFRRSREQRAVERMTDYGKRVLADRWPEQELDVLERAHAAGATVPYPVAFTGDGMLMQLIGDETGAAPRLVNARLSPAEVEMAYDQLLDELALLTAAGLVHADLSPFNVLWWQGRMWIIDFPQAVDLFTNPHGFDLLHHDVTTMCTWFARQGLTTDPEEVFAALLADGSIPDRAAAVGGPRRVTEDAEVARRLVELIPGFPPLTWGRDEQRTGDMWNSNSLVSWLLARSGHDMAAITPPPGSRAPGWDAGIVARRSGEPRWAIGAVRQDAASRWWRSASRMTSDAGTPSSSAR